VAKRRLTDKEVAEIYRSAWEADESQYIIAARYGISQSAVSSIKHGGTYAKVTGHKSWSEWFIGLFNR